VICDQWHVVVVPFPFSDMPGAKNRPALVLSAKTFNRAGHSVLAMITTSVHRAWPGDSVVSDRRAAGLRAACIVRLKLFTLDNRLILRSLGRLGRLDREAVVASLRQHVPYPAALRSA